MVSQRDGPSVLVTFGRHDLHSESHVLAVRLAALVSRLFAAADALVASRNHGHMRQVVVIRLEITIFVLCLFE